MIAEAFEISISGVIEIVTEELVIPFLLIPLYLSILHFEEKKNLNHCALEIRATKKADELYVLERQVNALVENRKINTLHGLILRNSIEEQETLTATIERKYRPIRRIVHLTLNVELHGFGRLNAVQIGEHRVKNRSSRLQGI